MSKQTYLIPTKNLENFNMKFIFKCLYKKFNRRFDIIFDSFHNYQYIAVYHKDKLVTDIHLESCDIINFDNDIDELNLMGFDKKDRDLIFLSDELEKLKNLNPNLESCLTTYYNNMSLVKEKSEIEFFIKDIFKMYIFDENIHPKYIHPNDKFDIGNIWNRILRRIYLKILYYR